MSWDDMGATPYGDAADPMGTGGMPYGMEKPYFKGMPFGMRGMPFGPGGMPFDKGGMPFGKGGMPFDKGGMSFGKGGMPFGKGWFGKAPGWGPVPGGGFAKQYPPGMAGIPYGFYPGYGLVQ